MFSRRYPSITLAHHNRDSSDNCYLKHAIMRKTKCPTQDTSRKEYITKGNGGYSPLLLLPACCLPIDSTEASVKREKDGKVSNLKTPQNK